MLIESSDITSPSSLFDELVLRHLHCAHLKAKLLLNRVDYATTALNQQWIDAETALAIVAEAGLLDFVLPSGVSSHE